MLMIKRNSGFLRSLISFPWFWDSSKCKISVRVQGFLKEVVVVSSLSMAEKDFTWFIQQGNKICKSYTICVAQSRNHETQGRNYPREGRLEGVEGEKGDGRVEEEEDISWTGSLLDVFPALPPTTPFILQTPLFKFVVLWYDQTCNEGHQKRGVCGLWYLRTIMTTKNGRCAMIFL